MSFPPDAEPTELKYLQSSAKFYLRNFRDGSKFTGSPKAGVPSGGASSAKEVGEIHAEAVEAAAMRRQSEESNDPLLAPHAEPPLTAFSWHEPVVLADSSAGGRDGFRFRFCFHFVGFARFIAFLLALATVVYGHLTVGWLYKVAQVRITLACVWVALFWNLINLVTVGLTLCFYPIRDCDRKTDLRPPIQYSLGRRRLVMLGAGGERDNCLPDRLFKMGLSLVDLVIMLLIVHFSLSSPQIRPLNLAMAWALW